MKSISTSIPSLAASLVLGAMLNGIAIAEAPSVEGDRVWVSYNSGQKGPIRRFLQKQGAEIHHEFDGVNAVAATIPARAIQGLSRNPHVRSIEVDPKRYLLNHEGPQEIPYGVIQAQADSSAGVSESHVGNVTICIIDTGLDSSHFNLSGNVLNGTNDSGTGNWYEDGHGHGTHVAGTIAATDQGWRGVVGVIESGAKLHIIKVFDDNGGWAYSSDLAKAMGDCRTAAGDGNLVVSMSLGGSFASANEEAAFADDFAGGKSVIVAAAGNDGNRRYSYPASYDSVISVAAVDDRERRARFSQRNDQVEISAAGVDVLSTYPDGLFATMSGTSMATPHVSGVAALVWSNHASCSGQQIRNALAGGAKDLGEAGRDINTGFGLVQAKTTNDGIQPEDCSFAGDGGGGDGGGGDGGGGGKDKPCNPKKPGCNG